MSVPRDREVESSNHRPAKALIALQTVRHCYHIYASSCIALVLYAAEMGTENSLHASAQYGEYSERCGVYWHLTCYSYKAYIFITYKLQITVIILFK